MVLAPGIYMDDIANIICQIFQYSIQQKHDKDYYIHVRITIPNINNLFLYNKTGPLYDVMLW